MLGMWGMVAAVASRSPGASKQPHADRSEYVDNKSPNRIPIPNPLTRNPNRIPDVPNR
jgi:hypothetical protein